jgi:hypothetical protein
LISISAYELFVRFKRKVIFRATGSGDQQSILGFRILTLYFSNLSLNNT